MYHRPHQLFFLALSMGVLTGCASGGGMGTEYGTGGMEEGIHLGGWGDGYGDSSGRPVNDAGSDVLDNDPHYSPTYHNPDFKNDRGFAYDHPATTAKAPDEE